MTESTGVMSWALAKLAAASGVTALVSTRIYDSLAPQGTESDYIILQMQSYNEIGTSIAGRIAAGDFRLMVKAVTISAGYASAEAILLAANTALAGQSGTFTGGIVRSCIRQSAVRYIEVKDGVRYNHYGNIYCVVVSAS